MRFCPFCSHENTVEAVSCAACGRRLPPLPQRRVKPMGMAGSAPVQRPVVEVAPVAAPVAPVAPVVAPVAPVAVVNPPAPTPVLAPVTDEQRALRASLVPPPTALRRQAPPVEERPAGVEARRATDVAAVTPSSDPSPTPTPNPSPDPSPNPSPSPSPNPSPTPNPNPSPSPNPSPTPTPTPNPSPTPTPTPNPSPTPTPNPSPTPTPADTQVNVVPPPTRIARGPEMIDRPFSPPAVMAVPQAPEPGMVNYARYAVAFARARWQRRRAVKLLQAEIKGDTDALDVVLGTLGREARAGGVDNRVLATENQAISDAERKKTDIEGQLAEVGQRKAEENTRFEELERERTIKLSEVERERDDAERELDGLEGQRRGLRDKRKEIERRQKAYHQAADTRDEEAGAAPLGDTRSELRRLAEGHRAEAAGLEPEKQDYERKLAALERPLGAAQSKVTAVRAEVDLAKRSLADAREGHRHRLAELEAELGRKQRELENTDGEIQRRLVTLGTLINLHRVDRPEFTELYQRVDRLRAAISARTGEIDHLTAEREAYDRGSLMRGYAVLGGAAVAIVTLIAILIAIL